MTTITITEALAEVKTIGKRIEKKQEFIKQYAMRQEMVKDPLAKDGSSSEVAIMREMQAIEDLQTRVVDIRRKIQASNAATELVIGDRIMSVTDWLTWRKEVAPVNQTFISTLRQLIERTREQARSKGVTVGALSVDTKPTDVVVNLNEGELAKQAENLEVTLGTLDGKLSLLNATTLIELL